MSTTTIELPADFVANIIGQFNSLFANFSGLFTLLFTVLLISLSLGILFSFLHRR